MNCLIKKINKLNKLICFLIIVVALTSAACSHFKGVEDSLNQGKLLFDGNLRDIKVFFTKSKGPEEVVLLPVNRKISKEDSVIDGAIRELFLGPTKTEELKGIMTEIPIGTRLINIEESEDEILVDISPQYSTGGGSATMQLRYLQIYKTLKRITPTKKIYLQVDGKLLKTIGGEGIEVTQPITKINDYTQKFEKTETVQP